MPHFDVRIPENVLDGPVGPRLIHGLASVEIFGVPDGRWGVGGEVV
ncbi:hypothetical protein [Streptomyces boncukensis]|uniref:Uncharacterized protein n=1 Tax=Streptomyces boncukensis TaxID=2711219 RepID=A0A6G4X5T2_9ACTN|nr:hypothetical protein [Streptomyces boncukensis]NGO72899.1 hypothetical protein [Streptomyces boncukensis]